jgi:hypothetical protein
LMKSKKMPNVTIVIGIVKTVTIGFTITLQIDKTIAAMIAVPNPDTCTPSNTCINKTNTAALMSIFRIHFIDYAPPIAPSA